MPGQGLRDVCYSDRGTPQNLVRGAADGPLWPHVSAGPGRPVRVRGARESGVKRSHAQDFEAAAAGDAVPESVADPAQVGLSLSMREKTEFHTVYP